MGPLDQLAPRVAVSWPTPPARRIEEARDVGGEDGRAVPPGAHKRGVDDEVLAVGEFNPRGHTGGLFVGGLAGGLGGASLGGLPGEWAWLRAR